MLKQGFIFLCLLGIFHFAVATNLSLDDKFRRNIDFATLKLWLEYNLASVTLKKQDAATELSNIVLQLKRANGWALVSRADTTTYQADNWRLDCVKNVFHE
jgi:hypothetical protein